MKRKNKQIKLNFIFSIITITAIICAYFGIYKISQAQRTYTKFTLEQYENGEVSVNAGSTVVYAGDYQSSSEGSTGDMREHPYITLKDAFNNLPEEGGIIKIRGNLNIVEWLDEVDGNKPVIIMGDEQDIQNNQNCSLTMGGDWNLVNDIQIKGLKIIVDYVAGSKAPNIFANGNTLIIGENTNQESQKVTMQIKTGNQYPVIFGGANTENLATDTNVALYSGTYSYVFGGSASQTLTGNTNVYFGKDANINTSAKTQYTMASPAHIHGGGYMNAITGNTNTNVRISGTKKFNVTASSYNGNISGNMELTVSGENKETDKVNTIFGMAEYASLTGNVTVNVNNLTVTSGIYGGEYIDKTNTTNKTVYDCAKNTIITMNLKSVNTQDIYGRKRSNIRIKDNTVAGTRFNYVEMLEINLDDVKATNIHGYNHKTGTTLDDKNKFANNEKIRIVNSNITGKIYYDGGIIGTNAELELSNQTNTKYTVGSISNGYTNSGNIVLLTNNFKNLTLKNAEINFHENIDITNNLTLDKSIISLDKDIGIISKNVIGTENSTTFKFIENNKIKGKESFSGNYNIQITNKDVEIVYPNSYTGTITYTGSLEESIIPGINYTVRYYTTDRVQIPEKGYIYVDQTYGQDTNSGSFEEPVQSITKAMTLVGEDYDKIVLMNDYRMNEKETKNFPSPTSFNETVEITSKVDNLNFSSKLYFNYNETKTTTINLRSNLKFDYIDFIAEDGKITLNSDSGKYTYIIYANGNPLHIGQNVTTNGKQCFSIYGGASSATTLKQVKLKIESGTWYYVYGGGSNNTIGDKTKYNSTSLPSDDDEPVVDVEITGGKIRNVYAVNSGSTVYGNVRFVVNNLESKKILTVFYTNANQGNVYGNVKSYQNLKLDEDIEYFTNGCALAICGGYVFGNVDGQLEFDENVNHVYNTGSGALLNGTVLGNAFINVDNVNYWDFTLNAANISKEANLYIGKKRNEDGTLYDGRGFNVNSTFCISNKDIEGTLNVILSNQHGNSASYVLKGAVYAIDKNQKEKTSTHINVILDNFSNRGSAIPSFRNFNSITLKNSEITIGDTIYVNEIHLDENSSLGPNGMYDIKVGDTDNYNGVVELKNNGTLNIPNNLYLYGSLNGVEDKNETLGTLNYNGNDGIIEISKNVNGYVGIQTTLEEFEIRSQQQDSNRGAFIAGEGTEFEYEEQDGKYIWKVFNDTGLLDYVYVRYNGNNNNSGENFEKAVATIGQAYKNVKRNGHIIVCGYVSTASWEQEWNKPVTITSIDNEKDYRIGDASTNPTHLYIGTTNYLKLAANTTFENIHFKTLSTSVRFDLAGVKAVFGVEGDTNSIWLENNKPITFHGNTEKFDLVLNAGNYSNIVLCDGYVMSKKTTIEINGGSINNFSVDSGAKGGCDISIKNANLSGTLKIANPSSKDNTYNLQIGEGNNFSEDFKMYLHEVSQSNHYGQGKIEIDGGENGINIPLIYMEGDNEGVGRNGNEITIQNATINTLYTGGTQKALGWTSTELAQEKNIINLGKNAQINDLYCGNQDIFANIRNVEINIKDYTANIANLYGYGEKGKQYRPENVTLNIDTSILKMYELNTKIYDIDNLNINEKSKVQTSLEYDLTEVKNLKLEEEASLYIDNSLTIGGNFESNGSIYFTDGSQLIVNELIASNSNVYCSDSDSFTELWIQSSKISGSIDDEYFMLNGTTKIDCNIADDETYYYWQIYEVDENKNYIYVSGTVGYDEYSGSKKMPVKTLTGAINRANETQGLERVYIIILDDSYIVENELPEHTYIADISNIDINDENLKSTNAQLIFESQKISLGGNTYIHDITINTEENFKSQSVDIFANGYETKIAENVVIISQEGNYPNLFGGAETKNVENTNLEVISGTYNAIYGGGDYGQVIGDVTLNIGTEDGANVSVKGTGGYNQTRSGVFGGGRNNGANVQGDINLNIYSGEFYRISGSGQGIYPEDTLHSGNVTINYYGGKTDRIYGGGQYGEVDGNVTLNIGGKEGSTAIVNEYLRGAGMYAGLTGDVTLNIKDGAKINEGCQFATGGYQGNVNNTNLNITGGEINTNVYLGGWGALNDEGVIQENLGKVSSTLAKIENVTINGNIYGGGNMGKVLTNTQLEIVNSRVNGNVFGGGNNADVQENTNVKIISSEIVGTGSTSTATGVIYGGSNNANVNGNTQVEIVSGTANQVFGGGNLGKVLGDTNVQIGYSNNTVNNPTVISNIAYGGGRGENSNFITVEGNSNVTISGIYTDVKNYGSITLGAVEGDILVNFIDYWTGNVTNRYKTMNGIDRATTVEFNNAYVLLENLADDGITKLGISDIENIKIPENSGLKISADGEISGNFEGGGTLYIDSEVNLTVDGIVTGETKLVLNPLLYDSIGNYILGTKERPFVTVNNENQPENAFVSDDNRYVITALSENGKTIYYIESDTDMNKYIKETIVVNAGKNYLENNRVDKENINLIGNQSLTAEFDVLYQLRATQSTGEIYKNISRDVQIRNKNEEAENIPVGTGITLIANDTYYYYTVTENNVKNISLSDFKDKDGNNYVQKENIYEEVIKNIDSITKLSSYNEPFKFIVDFENVQNTLNDGIYIFVLDIKDDNNEVAELEHITNAININNRDYIIDNINFDKENYNYNGIINISGLFKANQVATDLEEADSLKYKISLKDDKGNAITFPSGTKIIANETEYEANDITFVNLIKNLELDEIEQAVNLTIDLSNANSILKDGIYTIALEAYLADSDIIVSNIVATQNIDFTIVKRTDYGIKANPVLEQGRKRNRIFIIDEEETATRNIELSIDTGTLENPYIEIKSQKKINGEYIDMDVTLTEITKLQDINSNKQNVLTTFSSNLDDGTYRIVFELFDSDGIKYTEEYINFIVAREW